MAADTAIAAELVTLLNAGSYSKTVTGIHSYDDVIVADDLSGAAVRVMAIANEHELLSRRDGWEINAELEVTIAGPQKLIENGTENTAAVTAWMAFAKEIVDAIKASAPLGKYPIAITEAERFDREALRNENLFRTTVSVVFGHIEG